MAGTVIPKLLSNSVVGDHHCRCLLCDGGHFQQFRHRAYRFSPWISVDYCGCNGAIAFQYQWQATMPCRQFHFTKLARFQGCHLQGHAIAVEGSLPAQTQLGAVRGLNFQPGLPYLGSGRVGNAVAIYLWVRFRLRFMVRICGGLFHLIPDHIAPVAFCDAFTIDHNRHGVLLAVVLIDQKPRCGWCCRWHLVKWRLNANHPRWFSSMTR